MKPIHRLAVALLGGLLWAAGTAAEEPRKPLPPQHVKGGVLCQDCHKKENPSKAAVADESCMICHGDYPAMAEYTRHLNPNPHKPPTAKNHPGPFTCTDCHHQHKPPVVKCLDCHPDFKLKAR